MAGARDEDRPRRRPVRTHHNSMIKLYEVRWLRSFVLGHRAFGVRRRRAGRPQRSEDRTGDQRRRPKAALGPE
ncbi:MAG: hypothetical protein JO309_12075 [Pseudonocardiales bacterium]|nr:hypothetical protein [Pseudonocardiales bacterium]